MQQQKKRHTLSNFLVSFVAFWRTERAEITKTTDALSSNERGRFGAFCALFSLSGFNCLINHSSCKPPCALSCFMNRPLPLEIHSLFRRFYSPKGCRFDVFDRSISSIFLCKHDHFHTTLDWSRATCQHSSEMRPGFPHTTHFMGQKISSCPSGDVTLNLQGHQALCTW